MTLAAGFAEPRVAVVHREEEPPGFETLLLTARRV
jgi:hypothetical protein